MAFSSSWISSFCCPSVNGFMAVTVNCTGLSVRSAPSDILTKMRASTQVLMYWSISSEDTLNLIQLYVNVPNLKERRLCWETLGQNSAMQMAKMGLLEISVHSIVSFFCLRLITWHRKSKKCSVEWYKKKNVEIEIVLNLAYAPLYRSISTRLLNAW